MKRISFGCSFAADTFETTLKAWSKLLCLTTNDYTFSWLPYGVLHQDYDDFLPDIQFLIIRLQDVVVQHPESLEPVLTQKSNKRPRDSKRITEQALVLAANEVVTIVNSFFKKQSSTNSPIPLILVLAPPPPLDYLPNTDRNQQYNALEHSIFNQLNHFQNLHIELSTRLTEDLMPSYFNLGYSSELDRLLHSPYTTETLIHLAGLCWRLILRATVVPLFPRKVIALDCDNTLWDGVLGEDGINQIKFGQAAQHRLYLHRQMLNLQKNGMLLCLVSKNKDKDVVDAFRQHYDSVQWLLNIDQHIVSRRINWIEK
jgi:hypothetical protein